jgi:hypothetical protein
MPHIHGVVMEKPCQKMLNLLEVLNQLKSQRGEEGAHHARRILNEVTSGRKTVEDAIQEVKRLKISTF